MGPRSRGWIRLLRSSITVAMSRRNDPEHSIAKIVDLHSPIEVQMAVDCPSAQFSDGTELRRGSYFVTETARVKTTAYTRPAKIISESPNSAASLDPAP